MLPDRPAGQFWPPVDSDLVELHRWLAAFTNPQVHFDLCGIDEFERRALVEEVLDMITKIVPGT